MARPRKQKVLPETDAPVYCKKCGENLTDAVLGDPPVCPFCQTPVELKDKPQPVAETTAGTVSITSADNRGALVEIYL